MVVKEYNYSNGSSALDPKRQNNSPSRKGNQQKKHKKSIRPEKKSLFKRVLINDVAHIAAVILILGGITISRDARVFSTQKQLSQINREIKTLSSESEALQVELLKSSSLEDIESIAKEKLNMISPTKESIVDIGK